MYFLNGSPIKSASSCKDLGIIVSSDLSWSQHYNMIISKAYCHLVLIHHTFSVSIPIRAKKLLYLSLVRSQLMCCSQVWRPQMIKDIIALEKVQRRTTKYILNDFSLDYKARLRKLGIPPLMYFLDYQDIIFLVSCLKEPDSNFPILNYISFSSSNTHSSTFFKLTTKKVNSNASNHQE